MDPAEHSIRRLLSNAISGVLVLVTLWLLPMAQSKFIQERKQELTAEFWKAVIYYGETGVVVIDADTGAIVDINKSTERMLGWPREQIVGRTFFFLLPDNMQGRHQQLIEDRETRTRLLGQVCHVSGYVHTQSGVPLRVMVRVSGQQRDRYYYVVMLDAVDKIITIPSTSEKPPEPRMITERDFGEKIDVEPLKAGFAKPEEAIKAAE